MIRTGSIFGIAAAIAFAGGFFIPLPTVNVLVAFGSVIVLGWGAGYTAAKTAPVGQERGIGRGAATGAIAGGVVLVISTVAFLMLANSPVVQQLLGETLQQNPGAIDPNTEQPTDDRSYRSIDHRWCGRGLVPWPDQPGVDVRRRLSWRFDLAGSSRCALFALIATYLDSTSRW